MDDVSRTANSKQASSISGSTLGDGYREFFGRAGKSPFGNDPLARHITETVQTGSGAFFSGAEIITSSRQLHEKTEKTSGFGLNLGFFSIGDKKHSIFETDVEEHNAYFLIWAKKTGNKKQINDPKPLMTEESLALLAEDPTTFYREYGSNYVSSVTTGACAYVLVIAKGYSKEDAESKARKLEAAYKDDNGSASAAGKDSNFSKAMTATGGKAEATFYLPQEKMEKLEKDKVDFKSLQGGLQAVNAVATCDPAKANPIFAELSRYPFDTDTTEQIKTATRKLQRTYDVPQFEEDFRREHGAAAEYKEHPGNYHTVDHTSSVKTYFETKKKLLGYLVEDLNNDVFADTSDTEDQLAEHEAHHAKEQKSVTLVRKQLELVKHRYISSEAGEDAPKDAVAQAIAGLEKDAGGKNASIWVPKFSAIDAHKTEAVGYLYYNKHPITNAGKAPDASTTWKKQVFFEDNREDEVCLKVRDWMKDNLTPWQYLHCSVVFTASAKPVVFMSVVYPEH